MRITFPRPLLVGTLAAVLTLLGGPTAVNAAERPQLVTVPTTTSTTAVATSSTTTTAPAPTTTTAPPTTEPQTKILPAPQQTKIVDPTASTKPGDTSTTVPRSSLSTGQVDAVLRDQQRSGASTTSGLIEALRPLQNLGLTAQEAAMIGMGQFPVAGVANWTDDWLDPRDGPPPHQHQGTDVFAAFDTPVRAPVSGTVQFEDAGLGGKGAYVTAPDGTYYYMAHLSGFSRDLANGARVSQGQVVGYNGDSGNAKGGAPHVHFEVHPFGGAAVNPKPFLDAWLNAALAKVPEVIASFQPKGANGALDADAGVPQILLSTGLTRRFSSPFQPVDRDDRRPEDVTPTAAAAALPAPQDARARD